MNRRDLLLCSLLLLGMATLFFLKGVALAGHLDYVYLGMYPIKQIAPKNPERNELPENFINARWALNPTNSKVRWYSDNTDPTFVSLIETAISNWEHDINGIPELGWNEISDSNDADIVIEYMDCGSSKTLGYFDVLPLLHKSKNSGWQVDLDRNVNYWKKSNICINSKFN